MKTLHELKTEWDQARLDREELDLSYRQKVESEIREEEDRKISAFLSKFRGVKWKRDEDSESTTLVFKVASYFEIIMMRPMAGRRYDIWSESLDIEQNEKRLDEALGLLETIGEEKYLRIQRKRSIERCGEI